ncbi:hypothetical protein [Streptomyces fructofermentans]|uniref:DUF4304 domain-containing protein n=1 Tax=Streptomyces fructofermentans TaxID=152141 RepID=A0A918NEM0_9ACTN|nr:hypothetical protein [Streptomyces fructofermentans]GGX67073.1 hypothetical protein GCM10010515_38490 [Streptomyces fructofermentans]
MASTSPASRLVAAAARERLRPLGLRQRGRSRIWIDDHGWWLGVVEFPSPTWSRGSGLNVGAMWLWQDFDHLAFDFMERVSGSQEFRDEKQFAPVAAELARGAEERVEALRDRFPDLGAVARCLLERKDVPGYLWESFNAGVAAGLTGRTVLARARFAAVLAEDPVADWAREARRTARHLSGLAGDEAAVRAWARDAVLSCRAKLGLGAPPEGAGGSLVPDRP